MKAKLHNQGKSGGMSKGKLLLGAAGLFLFIVGVRRSFRTEAGEVADEDPPREREHEGDGGGAR
ncbi:MAG TPA: hypothetical protein VFQ76_16435 [Longimicrobiaceae bacterium]|nr:hypothetical protein [Longimicrobiaceae bacterium]